MYLLVSFFRVDDFAEQPRPNLTDGFDPSTATPLDYFWLMFPLNCYGNWFVTQMRIPYGRLQYRILLMINRLMSPNQR
jgi:hypothetical protein